jgi:hypothetical protein
MYRRTLPAFLLTAGVLAGCKPERSAAQPGSSAHADAAPAAPAVVTVTATDYRLALRFARVKRYRPDKAADQADTLETVRAIHEGRLSS